MSDILIKDTKMPENCLHCGFSHMASDCLKIWIICKPKDISVTDGDAVKDGRPDWCPLIEVPTPHGRLIDADAIPYIFGSTHATEYDTVTKFIINKMPTIIGAEDGI